MGKVKEVTVMLFMVSALFVVTALKIAVFGAFLIYYEAVLSGASDPFATLCTEVEVVTGGWICGL